MVSGLTFMSSIHSELIFVYDHPVSPAKFIKETELSILFY